MRDSLCLVLALLCCGCQGGPTVTPPASAQVTPGPAASPPSPEPVAVAGSPTPAPPASARGPVSIPAGSPKLEHIRIEAVMMATMPGALVEAPGRVEANPDATSHVNLPVPGRIQRVLVRMGDRVGTGQALMTVVSPEATSAQASLREADAGVRQASASLIAAQVGLHKATAAERKARADQQRVHELYKHDAVAKKDVLSADTDLIQSKNDVDSARAVIAQAQAGVDSARATRQQAASRLDLMGVAPNDPNPEIVVHAPNSGKIMEMHVVAGEYHSDLATPLVTIADLSSVWVTSNVPESQIRWIDAGEPVTIMLDAFPNETFQGRVARISDTLDSKTRTVRVMTTLANPLGKFRPEMFGRIRHEHQTRTVPVVTPTAILEDGQGNAVVYVATSPNTFEPRKITLGARKNGKVAVVKGLRAGERVVVDGAMLLKQ